MSLLKTSLAWLLWAFMPLLFSCLPIYISSEITPFSFCSIVLIFWMFTIVGTPLEYNIQNPKDVHSVLCGNRAPILYLRSFNDDLADRFGPFPTNANEVLLVSAFNDLGPVITVANPQDRYRGSHRKAASRVCLSNSEWQVQVEQLISLSQLVIIQADISLGLEWELSTCRKHLNPRQVLISFLPLLKQDQPTREKLYKRLKNHSERLLGCTMPAKLDGAFFAYFDEDWNGKLVCISRRMFDWTPYSSVIIRACLRDIVKDNLGLDAGWSRTIWLLLKASMLPCFLIFSIAVLVISTIFFNSFSRTFLDFVSLALAAFVTLGVLAEGRTIENPVAESPSHLPKVITPKNPGPSTLDARRWLSLQVHSMPRNPVLLVPPAASEFMVKRFDNRIVDD